MNNLRRKYEALKARWKDQEGTPEGDLCRKFVLLMEENYPDLLESQEKLPVSLHEVRWKDRYEKDLLVGIGAYLGTPALQRTNRPRLKVVLFRTDEPTHALILHAYEFLRVKLQELLQYTTAGFMMGCIPLPSDEGTPDEELDRDLDPDPRLLEVAMAARDVGERHRRRPLAITAGPTRRQNKRQGTPP